MLVVIENEKAAVVAEVGIVEAEIVGVELGEVSQQLQRSELENGEDSRIQSPDGGG